MNDNKLADIYSDEENQISVRLPYEKFQEFLFGFFKDRESLKKQYDIDFIASHSDILQFHHILSQKTEQNRFITPESFMAEILFDDNTKKVLHSFEALELFTETKDVGVNSVYLKWAFLRKNNDTDVPQKQTVSIFFDTVTSIIRPGVREPIIKNLGKIEVNIEHTDPIWSGEVLNHFENQVGKINAAYSKVYRFFRFLRQYSFIHKAVLWLTILSALGVVYLSVQWSDLTEPSKTSSELKFDLAGALYEGELGSAIKKDMPDELIRRVQLHDQEIMLQYFLIRDLVNDKQIGVLKSMQEKKYFNEKFDPIINKLIEGYYNDKTTSETIVNSIDAQLREDKAKNNIRFAYNYLRWSILIVFLYLVSRLYLFIFSNKSIIALTQKGEKLKSQQEKRKADYLQIIYGVLASLGAAVILFFLNFISFN